MTERVDRRTFLRHMMGLAITPVVDYKELAAGIQGIAVDGLYNHLYHQIIRSVPVTAAKIDVAKVQQPIDCPIYMFHMPSGYTVESVLYNNLEVGRLPITVSHLGRVLIGEADVPREPVFCLTFDDGYLIQYQQALPVLERYRAPATFYVMGTGWEGDMVHTYMTSEQIWEIHSKGFEIGSHTVNHPPSLIALRARNHGAYLAELFDSKKQLEELLQEEITTFAYPSGVYDVEMMRDVNTKYMAAVSTRDRRLQTLGLLYELGRRRN